MLLQPRQTTVIVALALTLITGQTLLAASGTWNVDGGVAGGQPVGGHLWSNPANWLGGTAANVADGAGNTARFAFGLSTNIIVNVDSDRTIGSMFIQDTASNNNTWTFSGTGSITLDHASGGGIDFRGPSNTVINNNILISATSGTTAATFATGTGLVFTNTTINGQVTLERNLNISTNFGTVNFAGNVTGNGNVTFGFPSSNSTVFLSGAANTFNGTLTMQIGGQILRVVSLAPAGIPVVLTSGNLDMEGNLTVSSLTGPSNIGSTGSDDRVLTLNIAVGQLVNVDSNIGGNGLSAVGLVKNGTGTAILSRSAGMSYGFTGADTTTVNAGTLLVTNTSGSGTGSRGVTVKDTATFGGTGIITGALAVQDGGTLAPGLSPGKLTIRNLDLQPNSIFEVELIGTTVASEYDQLAIGSAATSIDVDESILDLILGFTSVPSVSSMFTIIDNQTALGITGNFVLADLTVLGEGASWMQSHDGNDYTFSISYLAGTGNDVVLTLDNVEPTPSESQGTVPEPATAALLALASLAMTRRRRMA